MGPGRSALVGIAVESFKSLAVTIGTYVLNVIDKTDGTGDQTGRSTATMVMARDRTVWDEILRK
jgi:hypothetical protein